jgi:hypothetical protein
VDTIKDHDDTGNERLYLVSWSGFDDSWERVSSLRSRGLVAEYEETVPAFEGQAKVRMDDSDSDERELDLRVEVLHQVKCGVRTKTTTTTSGRKSKPPAGTMY